MKKKRFMGFLALASCVTLLTGCNSDAMFGLGGKWNQFVDWGKGLLGLKQAEPEQKPEEEEPAPAEPSKPEVQLTVFDLPEEVLPGTVLDLEEFVSVSGTNEAFAITLDEGSGDLASVEGHELTAVGEGVISFTVSVGDQSAKLSFRSISNERKAFREYTKDIRNDYILYHAHIDNNYIVVGGPMTRSDKYTYDSEFEETATGYTAGGFIEASDKNVYAYKMEEKIVDNQTVYEPHLLMQGDEPQKISEVAGPFAFDWEKLELTDDTILSSPDFAYVFSAQQVPYSAAKAMFQFTLNLESMYVGTQMEPVTLTGEDDNGDEIEMEAYFVAPLFYYNQQVIYFGDTLYYFVQSDDYKIDELEAYIASGEAPQSLPFGKFEDAIDAIVSADSFTLETDYGIFDADGVKVEKKNSDFASGTVGFFIAENAGKINAFVTPDQIHVEEDGTDELSFGYIKDNEGKVYSYKYQAGEGENPGKLVASPTSYSGFDKLDALESYRFLAKDAGLLDSHGDPLDLYENIFVNESVSAQPDPDNEPDVYFNICEFSGKSAYDLVYYLIYKSTPDTISNKLYTGVDYCFSFLDYNNEIDTLEVFVSFFNEGDTITEVTISSMVAADSSSGLYWGFSTTISVGATIPDRVVVEMPQAA